MNLAPPLEVAESPPDEAIEDMIPEPITAEVQNQIANDGEEKNPMAEDVEMLEQLKSYKDLLTGNLGFQKMKLTTSEDDIIVNKDSRGLSITLSESYEKRLHDV